MSVDYHFSIKEDVKKEREAEKAEWAAKDKYLAKYKPLLLTSDKTSKLEQQLVDALKKALVEGINHDMCTEAFEPYKRLSKFHARYGTRGIKVEVSDTFTLSYNEAKLWYELTQESDDNLRDFLRDTLSELLYRMLVKSEYLQKSFYFTEYTTSWNKTFNWAYVYRPFVKISFGDWWHLKYMFGRKHAEFTITIYIEELQVHADSEVTAKVKRELYGST